jgi:hypothetical protein
MSETRLTKELRRVLDLLTKRDKQKLLAVTFLQVIFGILDLLGVAAIGIVTALAFRGIKSQGPGDQVESVLRVTKLDNLEFQNNLFDVVRLDCLEESNDINKLFYKIFPYTSDNCIFLVDDIVPNNCPNRFLTYMSKASDGLLKPMWFGNKEGAWCKSTYNHNPFIITI